MIKYSIAFEKVLGPAAQVTNYRLMNASSSKRKISTKKIFKKFDLFYMYIYSHNHL